MVFILFKSKGDLKLWPKKELFFRSVNFKWWIFYVCLHFLSCVTSKLKEGGGVGILLDCRCALNHKLYFGLTRLVCSIAMLLRRFWLSYFFWKNWDLKKLYLAKIAKTTKLNISLSMSPKQTIESPHIEKIIIQIQRSPIFSQKQLSRAPPQAKANSKIWITSLMQTWICDI